jgi:hypothetical protein
LHTALSSADISAVDFVFACAPLYQVRWKGREGERERERGRGREDERTMCALITGYNTPFSSLLFSSLLFPFL